MNKKTLYISLSLIIGGLLISGIITSILAVNDFSVLIVDAKVRDFFYNIRGEKFGFIYWFFRIITEFGYIYVIVAITIAFCVYKRFNKESLILCFGSLIVWASNTIMKHFILRERPILENRWMTEKSSSFPSGHSMSAAFLYGMLIYFIYRDEKISKKLKITLVVICVALIPIVMISRMVLGVHYFTDVIVGAVCGLISVAVGIIVDSKINKTKQARSVQ